jgi:hypothetical protein
MIQKLMAPGAWSQRSSGMATFGAAQIRAGEPNNLSRPNFRSDVS